MCLSKYVMHLLVFVYASIQNVKMNRIHFNTFEWEWGGGAYRRMYFFLQVDGPMTGGGGISRGGT